LEIILIWHNNTVCPTGNTINIYIHSATIPDALRAIMDVRMLIKSTIPDALRAIMDVRMSIKSTIPDALRAIMDVRMLIKSTIPDALRAIKWFWYVNLQYRMPYRQ